MNEEIKVLNARIDALEKLLREVMQQLPATPPGQASERNLPKYEYVQSDAFDGSKGI